MSGDGRTKAALFYEYPPEDGAVFGLGRRERIEGLVDLYPTIITGANFDQHASALADVEVIFATWGIPRFDDHHFAVMPNLILIQRQASLFRSSANPLIADGVRSHLSSSCLARHE